MCFFARNSIIVYRNWAHTPLPLLERGTKVMRKNYLKNILIAFFLSAFVFIAFIYLYIFSAIDGLFLKLNYSGTEINNIILANRSALIAFSIIALSLISASIAFELFRNRLVKSFLYFLAVLYILLLIFIDSIIIWPILLIIAFISSYLKYATKKDNRIRPSIPVIYLIIAVVSTLFIFLNSASIINDLRESNTISKQVFSRISLLNGRESDFLARAGFNLKDSLSIAGNSFKENWLLGSGQATFSYDFSKNTKGITASVMPITDYIEKANFNDTESWVRVKKLNLYLLTMLATTGLLGVITYLAVLFIAIIIVLHIIKEVEWMGYNDKKNILAIFSFFISAIFVQFFIFNNIIVLFFFWISFALLLAESRILFPEIFTQYRISKEEENITQSRLKVFPFFDILFALLLFAAIIFCVKARKQWQAENNYYAYLINKAEAKDNLDKAISQNPQNEEYLIDYAKNSLDKINIELKKDKDAQDVSIITNEAVKAIEKVKNNVLSHPFSVKAFEAQGDVYSAVLPFVKKGGGDAIIKSFEKALELEPDNPRFIMELGKAYYLSGTEDGVDNAKINKAIDCFNKIIDSCGKNDDLLKLDSFSDMICLGAQDARILLAKSLEAKGSKNEAIDELEKGGGVYADADTETLFQLARLYFNNNNLDKAQEILLKVLEITPDNSNALYTLASIYEKNGEKDKAFLLFNRVLELNPDNEELKAKVGEFSGGER